MSILIGLDTLLTMLKITDAFLAIAVVIIASPMYQVFNMATSTYFPCFLIEYSFNLIFDLTLHFCWRWRWLTLTIHTILCKPRYVKHGVHCMHRVR